MELTKKDKAIILNWKKWGVKGDINKLFEYYKSCSKCECCNKEFNNTFDKCLDHNHKTLEFRYILCRRCNNNDLHIKIKNGDKIYGRKNKVEYDKVRYEKNKDKIKERVIEYKEKNKKDIAEKRKEKITCECGVELTKYHLNRHKKTKKHLAYLLKQ